MKYLITFNILDKAGRRTPVRASVEVKDLARPAAIRAALRYITDIGINVVEIPSSVTNVGSRPARKRPPSRPLRVKVELPRL